MFNSNLIFFDEANKDGSLSLYGLTLAVKDGKDKVEEVALPQITGRLLLEMGSGHAHTARQTRDA